MVEEKKISEKSYKWSHYGVIIYHVITAFILILSQYVKSLFSLKPRTIVIILGSILFIVSLLAIIPISQSYDKIIIE